MSDDPPAVRRRGCYEEYEMAVQMHMDADPEHELQWWAGYTFGWPDCLGSYADWCAGCVVHPRWAKRVARDDAAPVMLDNGAWPAYRDNHRLTLQDQCAALCDAMGIIGEYVDWMVLPDVVGDARETIWRVERSYRLLGDLYQLDSPRLMLPIQEGVDLKALDRQGLLPDGLFIGGATTRWKFDAARRAKDVAPACHLHMARISKPAHLREAARIGVDSFDGTTFVHGYNSGTDYSHRLNRYCQKMEYPC